MGYATGTWIEMTLGARLLALHAKTHANIAIYALHAGELEQALTFLERARQNVLEACELAAPGDPLVPLDVRAANEAIAVAETQVRKAMRP